MSSITNSIPDPMDFIYYRTSQFSDIRRQAGIGKVATSEPRLGVSENTGVFITIGQSLAAASCEGNTIPVNILKIDNIDIYTGGMYQAKDPLLGHGLATNPSYQGCVFTAVADQMITDGMFDRIILIPVAYGGTTVAQWDDDLHKLIIAGYRRAKALGINFVTGKLWQQGESDTATATQASYSASWLSMKTKVDAEVPGPWFVAKSTYVPGGTTNAGIRAACDSFVNGTDVFAGPDCDTLNSSNRYDDQHWNLAGKAAAATLWYNSLNAVF